MLKFVTVQPSSGLFNPNYFTDFIAANADKATAQVAHSFSFQIVSGDYMERIHWMTWKPVVTLLGPHMERFDFPPNAQVQTSARGRSENPQRVKGEAVVISQSNRGHHQRLSRVF